MGNDTAMPYFMVWILVLICFSCGRCGGCQVLGDYFRRYRRRRRHGDGNTNDNDNDAWNMGFGRAWNDPESILERREHVLQQLIVRRVTNVKMDDKQCEFSEPLNHNSNDAIMVATPSPPPSTTGSEDIQEQQQQQQQQQQQRTEEDMLESGTSSMPQHANNESIHPSSETITTNEYDATTAISTTDGNSQQHGNNGDKNHPLENPTTDNNSNMCDICLDTYTVGDEVCWSPNPECHHAFHKDCILDWLQSHFTCPCCRRNYTQPSSSSSSSASWNHRHRRGSLSSSRSSNNNDNDNDNMDSDEITNRLSSLEMRLDNLTQLVLSQVESRRQRREQQDQEIITTSTVEEELRGSSDGDDEDPLHHDSQSTTSNSRTTTSVVGSTRNHPVLPSGQSSSSSMGDGEPSSSSTNHNDM